MIILTSVFTLINPTRVSDMGTEENNCLFYNFPLNSKFFWRKILIYRMLYNTKGHV